MISTSGANVTFGTSVVFTATVISISGPTPTGQVQFLDGTNPIGSGTLSTSGVDFSLNYKIPHFDLGSVNPGEFKVGLNTTYTSTYNNNATPGQPGSTVIKYAGTFSPQFGNIARWRGTATFNWNKGGWGAQWQARFIGSLTALNVDQATGANAPMGGTVYHNVALDYAVPSILETPEWVTPTTIESTIIKDKFVPVSQLCAGNFAGITESVVHYGGNKNPEWITCMNEESSVEMAIGYAKIEGKPPLVCAHATVGLQHAAMGIYDAWCDRVPVYMMLGNTQDTNQREDNAGERKGKAFVNLCSTGAAHFWIIVI